MSSESEKMGYQLNEIGDVVRRYENRMRTFKNKAMRELRENGDISWLKNVYEKMNLTEEKNG